MSDFDREEERERLREKYERDQEKRQSTQRMSELLLRGATMTDSHCDDCGDPIFRYDGQQFCATCQAEGVPVESGEDTAETGVESATETEARARQEPTPGDEPAPEATGARTSADAAENGQVSPANTPDPRATEPASAPRATPEQSPTAPEPSGAARSRGDEASAGVGAARDSLARTVARFARRAEEAETPREAAASLDAAREAAEALAALDRR